MGCVHEYRVTGECCEVCMGCGNMRKYLPNCTFDNCGFHTTHSPFLSGYSRLKRFQGMARQLFYPHPENLDRHMGAYLDKRQPFRDAEDVLNTMASSKLKDKRFTSIHAFLRLFDPHYTKPVLKDIPKVISEMSYYFEYYETRFKLTFEKTPFFNYTFLLRHILSLMGLEQYLPFLKQMKSQPRINKYNKLLAVLGTPVLLRKNDTI